MSCFIMDEKALAALAIATGKLLNQGFNYFGFEAPRELYDALSDCKAGVYRDYKAPLIYAKLYALNAQAYAGRYRKDVDTTPPDVNFSGLDITCPPQSAENSFAGHPWPYQLAKLIDYYCYQVGEDATRGDDLTHTMAKFARAVYAFIVQHSAEYATSPWGTL